MLVRWWTAGIPHFTEGAWCSGAFVRSLKALARVVASLDATIEMGRRLGLRAQVYERLLAVLDAALELRKLPGGSVDGAAPLILRVADVEVAYALDLDSESVHILSVDAFRDGRAEDHWPFAWRSRGEPSSRS